ncbi:type 2 isopentenyl-diphosphate Delta-isomerase [Priestia koreensis]|uniref:type 2 isopentenyl-diphosphate Delta-isomerase n=1 Tax=Priestia koreensis TaxID=284581 RepID=UPI00345B1411
MNREKRKIDHIHHAIHTGQHRLHGFEDVRFVHNSLPDTNVDGTQIKTKIGELTLSSPIFINAMTGGGGKETEHINHALAEIANECGLALAVGSQMSAIKNKEEESTYRIVRKRHPQGKIFANLGSEATVDQAKKAVDMLEADAMQVHLNIIQELVMPEGDRHFSGALRRIEALVKELEVPVIVKEVGYGMTRETVKKLDEIGVPIVDVGGYGGTNFSRIENKRRTRELSFFDEWGITTVTSLAEVTSSASRLSVIGSGGIQTSLDVAKSIALGASATGMAGYFLKVLVDEGQEAVIEEVEHLHKELKMIMTAVGATSVEELKHAPIVLSGDSYHWLNQRGVDTTSFARRS